MPPTTPKLRCKTGNIQTPSYTMFSGITLKCQYGNANVKQDVIKLTINTTRSVQLSPVCMNTRCNSWAKFVDSGINNMLLEPQQTSISRYFNLSRIRNFVQYTRY